MGLEFIDHLSSGIKGKIECLAYQGALHHPSKAPLTREMKEIMSLKIGAFILTNGWVVKGISEPKTLLTIIENNGYKPSELFSEHPQRLAQIMGYFEPITDEDVHAVHVLIVLKGINAATYRLRILHPTIEVHYPINRESAQALLKSIQGSLSFSGTFSNLLDKLVENNELLLDLASAVAQAQVAECTNVATIFHSLLKISSVEREEVFDLLRRIIDYSGIYETTMDIRNAFLAYIVGQTAKQSYQMGAKFLITPVDIKHVKLYEEALGRNAIPISRNISLADIYRSGEAVIISQGKVSQNRLIDIPHLRRTDEIRTIRDDNEVTIACIPLSKRCIDFAEQKIQEFEGQLKLLNLA